MKLTITEEDKTKAIKVYKIGYCRERCVIAQTIKRTIPNIEFTDIGMRFVSFSLETKGIERYELDGAGQSVAALAPADWHTINTPPEITLIPGPL